MRSIPDVVIGECPRCANPDEEIALHFAQVVAEDDEEKSNQHWDEHRNADWITERERQRPEMECEQEEECRDGDGTKAPALSIDLPTARRDARQQQEKRR